MIGREQARLRDLFQRLVAFSLATVPAACSTASSAGSTPTPDGSVQGASDSGGSSNDAPSGPSPGNDSGGGAFDASLPDSGSAGDDGSSGDDGGGGPIDASCTPDFLDGADDGSGCDLFWGLACGLPSDAATSGCFLSLKECAVICGHNVSCKVAECGDAGIIPTGPISIECATFKIGCGSVGRRPEGLVDARPGHASDAVGEWLAENARLEAASVHAFRRLGAELSSHGAPRALVRAAGRSAHDEVRHARVTSRLARRRGAVPAPVGVCRPRRGRSLEAFAIENAVEGCVREAFGALVATRQARAASDPRLRAAMGLIALDETRHAALAWAVARWLEPQLDASARERAASARRGAVDALRCEVRATSPSLAKELGLPCGEAGAALVDAFAQAIFA